MRRRAAPVLVVLAFAVSCADESPADGVPSPLPSGELGVVTPEAASAALDALCELPSAPDLDAAQATFLDRAHQTLHVVAAAAGEVDRAAAAALLRAKQRVEADLDAPSLPPGFAVDVDALRAATAEAVAALGLDPPACPGREAA